MKLFKLIIICCLSSCSTDSSCFIECDDFIAAGYKRQNTALLNYQVELREIARSDLRNMKRNHVPSLEDPF